jgi:hypothetical protein
VYLLVDVVLAKFLGERRELALDIGRLLVFNCAARLWSAGP